VVHQQYIGAGAELERENENLIDYIVAVIARFAAAVARKAC